jgi:alkylated DNA nucleotide flippase Atl1
MMAGRKSVPIPAAVMDNIRRGRDAEWTRVLGIKGTVLTPEEYKKLRQEKVERNGGNRE